MRNVGLDRFPVIIDWSQGEADTDAATPQADYQLTMHKIVSEARATGLLRPGTDTMFVHKNTRIAGSAPAREAVRAAQAAVCDGVLVREGADIDSLDATHRYDGTHFSFDGAAAQAAVKFPVYEAWLSR